ncbi:MAG TPA: hypothetical protein VFE55_09350 [Acidimicrobiia bacterium]|nr:hypothetical protein [Acidimicrobiia bacterium]
MRRILLCAAAAVVWLGVAAAPASAHSVSGVSATNFHTHLTSVTPEVPGLDVKVIEAGSRLQLENHTGQEVLVLGYKDEPYLRVGPEGVFQNRLSPATYLNQTRKGNQPPPAAENAPVGATDWQKVSSEPVARWHDHRIHWMLATNPPMVQRAPGSRHIVIPEWTVKMKQGDRPITVKGNLTWEPGSTPLPWYALALVLLLLVLAIGRSAAWAPGLAAVTGVVVAVDIFHNVGLGLANAGGLGYRLGKAISQSPFSLLGWAAGILGIVWLLRRRTDGLSAAGLAGFLIALLGGVSDATALARSEVPFGFGPTLARLAVTVSIGLGLGLAVATALRLAGIGIPAPTKEAPRKRQPAAVS